MFEKIFIAVGYCDMESLAHLPGIFLPLAGCVLALSLTVGNPHLKNHNKQS